MRRLNKNFLFDLLQQAGFNPSISNNTITVEDTDLKVIGTKVFLKRGDITSKFSFENLDNLFNYLGCSVSESLQDQVSETIADSNPSFQPVLNAFQQLQLFVEDSSISKEDKVSTLRQLLYTIQDFLGERPEDSLPTPQQQEFFSGPYSQQSSPNPSYPASNKDISMSQKSGSDILDLISSGVAFSTDGKF